MQFSNINYVHIKLIKLIFIFLISILFTFNVHSINYYVDASKGSDSNNGLSTSSAFKTIDYAVKKLDTNDILYIMNGTYYLNSKIRFEFKDFGNSIITAFPNHKPVIKQNIQRFENPSSGTWIKSNEAGNIWYTIYDSTNKLFIAQYSDTKTSLLTYESFTEFKNLNKPDGIYYDSSSKRLYIKFKDPSKDPNNIKLLISKEIAFELYDVKGLTIANLSIIGATRCINVDASSNLNIEGNTCFGSFLGFSVKTSRNIRINKNTAYMKRDPSFSYYDMKNRPYETSGIFLQDNYEGIVVKNNKVYGHFNGILVYSTSKGKHSNIDVSYNTIYDIYDDGLEIEDYCNGGRFHHNEIKDAFVGISLSPADASEKRCFLTDNLIIPNKAVKWDSSGAIYEGECYKIISPGLMQNWNISKSTCIGRGVYSIEYESSPQRNNVWENNIFYSDNKKLILKSGLSSNGVYYNNNLYYRTDGGVIFQYWNSDSNNREFFSLSDALSNSLWDGKWDTKSKNQDPLFNDITKNDYRPKANSIACKMSTTGSYVGAFPCINQNTNQNITTNTTIPTNTSNNNSSTNNQNSTNTNNQTSIENPIVSCNLEDKIIIKNNNLTRVYNLKDCFNDPLNKSLSYTVVGAKNIRFVIDLNAMVSIYPSKDWIGNETIYFKAFDENRSSNTNRITIKVINPQSNSSQNKTNNQTNQKPREYCGDGICNNNEDCQTCSKDCSCAVVESRSSRGGSSRSSSFESVSLNNTLNKNKDEEINETLTNNSNENINQYENIIVTSNQLNYNETPHTLFEDVDKQTNGITGNLIKINDFKNYSETDLSKILPLTLMLLSILLFYNVAKLESTKVLTKKAIHKIKAKSMNLSLFTLKNSFLTIFLIIFKNFLKTLSYKTLFFNSLKLKSKSFMINFSYRLTKFINFFTFKLFNLLLKIASFVPFEFVKNIIQKDVIQTKKIISEKSIILTEEIKKTWINYFKDCEKIGFTLKEIKEFLLFEKGYDKNLIELLLKEYETFKYNTDSLFEEN